jgi:solute carrier family 25, member 39/40
MSGAAAVGRDEDITATQRMISATWGSVLTTLLVTPLDVVRVRLQSQSSTQTPAPTTSSKFHAYGSSFKALPPNLGISACCRDVFWVDNNAQFCLAGNGHGPVPAGAIPADCAIEESEKKVFRSTYDGLKKIARHEGPTTLWRGMTPTLMMAIPGNVIYFTGYDWLRYNPASPIRKITNDTYAPLFAGSSARVLAGIAVSPLEMFRTRMQATPGGTTGVFRETLQGLYRMTQTQGITSLWRGLVLTMWRDVPFSAIYWWGYEATKNQLMDARAARKGHDISSNRGLTTDRPSHIHDTDSSILIDSFIAGAVSGGVAAFVTTPFDVGKTRQQTYRHAGDDAPSVQAAKEAAKKGKVVPELLSMPRFLYHIFTEEGAAGLFKGWIPRTLKVAPACAIMISTYEIGKRWAKATNAKKSKDKPEAV